MEHCDKKVSEFSSVIRVSFVTLGCAKNLVDTEKMLGLLAEAGFILVDAGAEAEVTIINTCGFIAEARREALDTIEAALEDKRAGRVGAVIVVGCLAQYQPEQLLEQLDGIDAVAGLAQRDHIARVVERVLRRPTDKKGGISRPIVLKGRPAGVTNDQARLRITEPSWAYLRVSEGCDRRCAFCTIPRIRGPFRSKSREAIIAEAEELVADGAVELNLIGQETTNYGVDLGYAEGLAGLLPLLNRIEGLRWLRVLYAHPATLSDEQIAAMGQCDRVVPYLDLPLQHVNDRLLKLMRRGINRRQTEALLRKLRRTIDNLALRTTMLVGFPSETKQEFQELLDFVKDHRFEALGAFRYSPEPGTTAVQLAEPVADELKQERFDSLMTAQQEIAFECAEAQIGRTLECLVVSEMPDEHAARLGLDEDQRWFIARHRGQAPEIDSECYLTLNEKKKPPVGTLVKARINARVDYDLIGVGT